jgi:glycosyltransferase involved in cell wall biosynthesis
VRILIAHNRYSSREPSGENIVVDREAELLGAAGVRVELFERSSDDIAAMSLSRRIALAGAPIYSSATQRALGQVLETFRPDVLHLHNPYPLLSPWVVRTARRFGVPVVHTVHNYRFRCAAGTCFRDGDLCVACLATRTHWPAVAHGCYRDSRAQSAIMASALTVHRHTWESVACFLAVSETVATFLYQQGVPRQRVRVKPNIVADPGRHEVAGEGFLFVGRLTEEKGVAVLLSAWCRHPDSALGTLRVIGDGPLRRLIEDTAACRRDVEFLGPRSPAEVSEEMRRAAAVVVPSVWSEPFCLVALEAMANARPVLATSAGALPEVIGATGGWIIEPTENALAEAFPMVAGEAAGRARAARARYDTEYAADVLIGRLLDVYNEVASHDRIA